MVCASQFANVNPSPCGSDLLYPPPPEMETHGEESPYANLMDGSYLSDRIFLFVDVSSNGFAFIDEKGKPIFFSKVKEENILLKSKCFVLPTNMFNKIVSKAVCSSMGKTYSGSNIEWEIREYIDAQKSVSNRQAREEGQVFILREEGSDRFEFVNFNNGKIFQSMPDNLDMKNVYCVEVSKEIYQKLTENSDFITKSGEGNILFNFETKKGQIVKYTGVAAATALATGLAYCTFCYWMPVVALGSTAYGTVKIVGVDRLKNYGKSILEETGNFIMDRCRGLVGSNPRCLIQETDFLDSESI
ncbi:MAG: hypothetical protein LBQ03_02715 [Puniceicoccales bacterium]|nr:hypothetical protein [Puniceicoccales bacterium]